MNPRSTRTPAGIPETVTTMPGPWDSPAVMYSSRAMAGSITPGAFAAGRRELTPDVQCPGPLTAISHREDPPRPILWYPWGVREGWARRSVSAHEHVLRRSARKTEAD